MKQRILPLIALCSLAALAGSKEESTTEPKREASPPTERISDTSDQALLQRTKSQQELIGRRVGMSAPLDATETTDPSTGIDAIQELYGSGSIIPPHWKKSKPRSKLRPARKTPKTTRPPSSSDTAALTVFPSVIEPLSIQIYSK